jgi:hypothetical protein
MTARSSGWAASVPQGVIDRTDVKPGEGLALGAATLAMAYMS